jgi:hypothetical protein
VSPPVRKLQFENFKGFSNLEVQFDQPLNVLVGANGVGKSTVLHGAELLGKLSRTRLDGFNDLAREFASSLLEECGRGGAAFKVTASQSGQTLAFGMKPALGSAANYVVSAEDSSGKRVYSTDAIGADSQVFASPVLKAFSSSWLRLEPSRLSESSAAPTKVPALEASGRGLPSVLAWIANNERERLNTLENQLRLVVPQVQRVRMPPDLVRVPPDEVGLPSDVSRGWESVAGYRLEVLIGDFAVPARSVSEGTLLTLGILAAIHGPNQPSLLMLDDIDRGLHPQAQAALIGALRTILSTSPQLQIICTTHSPYLLDHFTSEEVTVLARSKESSEVRVKRLSDHADWSKFKDTLSPGEFWSSVGEDWLFGAQ